MPQIKSSRKRMRQAEAAREHNRERRSQLRTAIKKVRTATTSKEATRAYTEAVSMLDRAARKNLVHRNAAARTKSRLARVVSEIAPG
ncbi:MAG: 30S ribosomal protein S20 [Gemmatimonadales bacterium]